MLRKLILCIFASLLGLAGMTPGRAAEAPGSWPQWRGPNRDGVSTETELLREWPKDGPPLLWKAQGIGTGYAPVSVAGGRIISVGYRKDKEYVFALDGDGKELWATPIGPTREAPGMLWFAQRQPTVDGERVYAVTNYGGLICLESSSGKELWRKSYRDDFKGLTSSWGSCDYPLVDGDRLICCPGGKTATVVALDKKTGEVVWRCPFPEGDVAEPSVLLVSEACGVRQYVKCFQKGLAGISAEGKLLWRYAPVANGTVNVPPSLIQGDHIFATGSYGRKSVLLQLVRTNEVFEPKVVYESATTGPWSGHVVRIGDFIYHRDSSGFTCLEFKTGKVIWQERMPVPALVVADGQLYARHDDGQMRLLEPSPTGLARNGIFTVPRQAGVQTWTMPVIAGGRLYLRDQNLLCCYDVRDPKKKTRGPRPPFVPSPQDVVEKMLELAEVKETDVVVDLGCGDGRIVITAAKKYGCKAIGYDLSKECIRLAREKAEENFVQNLVRIEYEDIFHVDLSKADVVCLYLLPSFNEKLVPQLEKMKPGSRVVSHAFGIKGYVPAKVITCRSKEDEQERKLYLWTVPLKTEPAKE